MKYFIAFLLLFFAPNFAPNTAFAAINSTSVVSHATVSPIKKLSFKDKLLLKLLKKEGKKLNGFQWLLIVGILLLIVGVILLFVGDSKAKAAPPSLFGESLAGLGETLGGIILGGLGLVITLIGGVGSASQKTKVPKQVP
jgi:hypothetical protein